MNDETSVSIDDIYDMAQGFIPLLAEDAARGSEQLGIAIAAVSAGTLGRAHASWTALAQNLQWIMGTTAQQLRDFAEGLNNMAVDMAEQDGRNAGNLGSKRSELDDATEWPFLEKHWTKPDVPSQEPQTDPGVTIGNLTVEPADQ